MHETRTLAQFVVQTQFTDLPKSLIDECKIAVLDTFGAGFVGATQPWAQRVVELVRELGGPSAAAVAIGKLYGFDQGTLVSAMGLAGSCSAGLLEFAWSGADTKRLHLGRASHLGLESALLARQGLRGPATVLGGRYGYFNAFSLAPRMDRLLEGLGSDWAIQPPSLKSYATHVTHQAVVQAIQDFK